MAKKIRRRNFFKIVGATTAGIVLAGGGTIVYTYCIEPSWIDVVQQPLHLPRLGEEFAGYKIVQISDLHADDSWRGRIWMNKARMEEVVQVINEQMADIVVITGDFVTHVKEQTSDTLSPLGNLKARDGVYAILGNHDHWSDPQIIRGLLQQYGIHDLSDSSHTLRKGKAQLHLVGLDDLWATHGPTASVWSHEARLRRVLSGVPSEGSAILLVHEPDFADVSAAAGRFDLELSGHSHGGQVQLPLYGPLQMPPLGERYPSGLYQVGKMYHYTNRGIGMVSPHVRFDCRPEISIFSIFP